VLNLIDSIRDHIPASIKGNIPTEGKGTMFSSLVNRQAVDWEATSAYVLSDGLLFCDEIAIDLIDDYFQKRGLSVELFDLQAEYTADPAHMPDYVVYIEDLAFEIKDQVFTDDIVTNDPIGHSHQGSHRRNGVFIGYGSSFGSTRFREMDAWLPDVAPTLLTILDRSIPEKMTGDPLSDLLSDATLANQPPERVSCGIRSDTDKLDEPEEQQVNKRLQNLGYLK